MRLTLKRKTSFLNLVLSNFVPPRDKSWNASMIVQMYDQSPEPVNYQLRKPTLEVKWYCSDGYNFYMPSLYTSIQYGLGTPDVSITKMGSHCQRNIRSTESNVSSYEACVFQAAFNCYPIRY